MTLKFATQNLIEFDVHPIPLFGKEGAGEIFFGLSGSIVLEDTRLLSRKPPRRTIKSPFDPPFPKGELFGGML
jgi:hypothetical protein